MSRLDLVIFGATGFTGRQVVKELTRVSNNDISITWGIAGRTRNKLEKVLEETSKKTGYDLSSVRIIIADAVDEKSLQDMCAQCKVLMNCCGFYQKYGEPVVRAAIESKTSYVDISAEPQFMEKMNLEYDQKAREAGVYIVTACGFGSIPNDMGVIFLQQNFEGTLNSVESYLSTNAFDQDKSGAVNYGTWESLIHGLGNYYKLAPILNKLYPEKLPTFKPKLKYRLKPYSRDHGWLLPYWCADPYIMYRTQRLLYESERIRPVQIKTYVTFRSFCKTLAVAFAATVVFILANMCCTKNLLLKHYRLFSWRVISKEDISEEVMNNTKFQFELIGEGWEPGTNVDTEPTNKKLKAKVSGVNPGYGATVVALVHSALTIIKEKDKMPAQGGVMTTGIAFRNTNLIQRLCENNLVFEIVDDNQI